MQRKSMKEIIRHLMNALRQAEHTPYVVTKDH